MRRLSFSAQIGEKICDTFISNMTEIIGWASSLILLLTLIKQVYKQWKDGETEGISSLLFIGQFLSSIGFTIYSFLVSNWVFTITNGILAVNNIVGVCLYFYFLNNPLKKKRET